MVALYLFFIALTFYHYNPANNRYAAASTKIVSEFMLVSTSCNEVEFRHTVLRLPK